MFIRIKKFVVTFLFAFVCLCPPISVAQETEALTRLTLSFIGVDDEVLANVEKHVGLFTRLKDPAPLSNSERHRLQRHIAQEIREAVQPYGYYLAEISPAQSDSPSSLVYKIELNEPVRIKQLSLTLMGTDKQKLAFNDWVKNYSLQEGQRLEQAKYEVEKKTLLAQALRLGYFDAKLTQSSITIDKSRTQASIVMKFVSGNQYSISKIQTNWAFDGEASDDAKRHINESLIQTFVTVKVGEPFDSDELVKTQRSLLTTPYFSSVSVQAGELNSTDTTLPINITLTPKKRNAYSAEVGVGTDTGVRGGFGYENRRVNSRGHNLSARLGASQIRRSAIVNYQIPRTGSIKDSLNFFLVLEEQEGDLRRFESVKLGTEYLKDWNGALLKLGLTASRETFPRVLDDGLSEDQTTDLLVPRFSWERTKLDDLYSPTRGWSASLAVRGASEDFASDVDLAQIIFDSKMLTPLGTGRVKLRLKLAGSLINESSTLPESLGFLAGGDDSIRGYSFESIGVDNNGEISVAKNLIVGSVEYERPIKNGISWATFFDIGDAFDDSPDYQHGAGVGLRWRLPFGAMRLDVASALDEEGDPLRLHFSFGTDL